MESPEMVLLYNKMVKRVKAEPEFKENARTMESLTAEQLESCMIQIAWETFEQTLEMVGSVLGSDSVDKLVSAMLLV